MARLARLQHASSELDSAIACISMDRFKMVYAKTASVAALTFAILILPACSDDRLAFESGAEVDREREVFMWIGARKLRAQDPKTLNNILRFARRHEIIPYESGANDPDDLRQFLEACQALGIERTWIEIGPGRAATARAFAEEPESRAATIERFKELARVYKAHYPDFARITIFDEAPLGGFARPGPDGRSYLRELKAFRKHGPKAFSHMYKAIKEVMPRAEVGVFLHHPHNASEKMAGKYSFINEFMEATDRLGAAPDFIFSDVYRGYFNRGFGVEHTNRYITDVVSNTRRIADAHGAKAYQLGQVHTIKLGYTPSRLQIDTNVDAMLAGNPHGIGWYWPNYASTNYRRISGNGIGQPEGYDVSFDPFVPNSWGKIGPAGSLYATSRDRFVYSYLRIKEAIGDLERAHHFDLWIYGYDFDHVEHDISLMTPDGWVTIGSFNPQQDVSGYEKGARRNYMYSYQDRWHAVAFHGLKRSRFLSSDSAELKVRITSSEGSDQSKLSAIYAMPYRATRHYATEEEISSWIESHPRWVKINSLATHVRPRPLILKPGEDFIGKLQVTRSDHDPRGAASEWFERLQEDTKTHD